ncbi:MAG: AI-2E family transporter [Aquisalimonadaceae bacterium]
MRAELIDSRAWPLVAALVLAGLLIWALQPILTPFLVAALLAYLGDPLADRLERLGIGRTLAVVIVFTLFLLLALIAVLLLLPVLGRQVDYLQQRFPHFIEWLQQSLMPWLEARFGVDLPRFDVASLREAVSSHWQSTGNVVAVVLERVTQSGLVMLGLVMNLALIPVVTFYLLRDWDRIIFRIRELLPRRMEPVVSQLAGECNDVVAAFLRGQLLVMLALGLVYTAGLALVGLELALLIGMLAGLASIVPYLGVIVGVGSAALAVLFQFSDPWVPLALVGLVFVVGQVLESVVLTPVLVGDRIGLHPVAVIFAVLAGGQLFGFTGVLLALPVSAVIAVLLRHADRRYRDSRLYGKATEPEATPPTTDQP